MKMSDKKCLFWLSTSNSAVRVWQTNHGNTLATQSVTLLSRFWAVILSIHCVTHLLLSMSCLKTKVFLWLSIGPKYVTWVSRWILFFLNIFFFGNSIVVVHGKIIIRNLTNHILNLTHLKVYWINYRIYFGITSIINYLNTIEFKNVWHSNDNNMT